MGNIYTGNNNIARKANKIYVGVNGVARQAQKIYIGDANGIAREVYSGFTPVTGILARANFFIAPDQTPVVACTPASQNEETYEWGKAIGRVSREYSNVQSTTVRLTLNYSYIKGVRDAGFTTLRIHPYLNYRDTYQYSQGADIWGSVNDQTIYNQFVQRQTATYSNNIDISLSTWLNAHTSWDTLYCSWEIEARGGANYISRSETYFEITWL